MPVKTVEWKGNKLRIIDQTLLPSRLKFVYCVSVDSVCRAIKSMKIRGAPALGIAAAYGVYLGIRNSKKNFFKDLDASIKRLASSRPTARNLFWVLERMRSVARSAGKMPSAKIKKLLLQEAHRILREDKDVCRRIGEAGQRLVKTGDTVLTHCNAGALATADYGTALGVLFSARRNGKKIRVFADETRPVLQGARLTAWELMREGMDVTLICDSMAASLMAKGAIDKVIVGADRIAANGDVVNKIGTYNVAVLARHHRIPFYVAAPLSTIDLKVKNGRSIPIERRHPDEIRKIKGAYIAPRRVKVLNPAFDVTPNRLVTAIITEKGVLRKPFGESIRKAMS